MAKFGHNKQRIKQALELLSEKDQRFIEPVHLNYRAKTSDFGEVVKYCITEKGEFYLKMANWEEYQKKYGPYGRSVIGEML